MDAELKTKWTLALRSGQYEQGQTKLRIGDKYCCLGVLCDVSGKGKWEDHDEPCTPYKYKRETGFGFLPEALREEIGIPREDVDLLVRLNDDKDFSFKQIADYIEANL